jgi:predicted dehydrogenase
MLTRSEPLRVAVIGCGFIGELHARAVQDSPNAVLVATMDVDLDRAKRIAGNGDTRAYWSLDHLLANEPVDVVTVATPDHLHFEPTMRALERGVNVFCEKPLSMSLEECQAMVAAADKAGVQLGVDYNRRFGFGYRKAKELIDGGRIGDVIHSTLRVTDGIPSFVKGRGPYALLTSLLTHHIDLLRWLCGEIESVHARFAHPNKEEGQFRDVLLSFRFKGGAHGALVGGWREGSTRTIEWSEVGGTAGVVQIDDVQRNCTWHGLSPDVLEVYRPNYFWGEDTAFYATLDTHVKAFLSRLSQGQPAPVSGAEGVRGLEVVNASIASHESGQEVAV